MLGNEDSSNLQTVYDYYTSGGISAGLSDTQTHFTLNNKEIKLFSGALHYFRVPKAYWQDRLQKYRAAGLNCIETYVPWNLHEPEERKFEFNTQFTQIEEFLQLAQKEDLLVILRPGPYICAEWEFGGLPSWLLRYKDIKIRTSDAVFMRFVEKYFEQLLKRLEHLQFTKGGSIIAVQIENEYGNTKKSFKAIDTNYLKQLRDILRKNGIVELLFTSDTPSNGFSGTLPDILATANFQSKAALELGLLKLHQPWKPLMVMEYWTGWFDHWAEKHHTRTTQDFAGVLGDILGFGASFNLYMMHGGTNWGFMNGGNLKNSSDDNGGYQSDVTSYDYDAPLAENGDYTPKYEKLCELTEKYSNIKFIKPDPPQLIQRTSHPDIEIIAELSVNELLTQIDHVIDSIDLKSMEMLDGINNGSGQSYGYIVYRKTNIDIDPNSVLKICGRVCDTLMVLVNGELKSPVLENHSDLDGFGYWRVKDGELKLTDNDESYKKATLDLVVENWGRVNYGKLHQFNQYKGLWQGDVCLNNKPLKDWQIYPLEFEEKWTKDLKNWKDVTTSTGPKLYKAILTLDTGDDIIRDTYIDMRQWCKGVLIVNNFVLARYCKLGPPLMAYLPAPFLKNGENEILIFEHFTGVKNIKFATDPVYLDNKTTGLSK